MSQLIASKISLHIIDRINKLTKNCNVYGEALNHLVKQTKLPNAGEKINLLPWFSIIGITIVVIFCLIFGMALSYFLQHEILKQDAILTSSLITSVEKVNNERIKLNNLLFKEVAVKNPKVTGNSVSKSPVDYYTQLKYEHLRQLPGVQLVNVFEKNRSIIWSNNANLINKIESSNADLEKAFASGHMVFIASFDGSNKDDLRFTSEPGIPHVESYTPLFSSRGEVVAVVELHKQLHRLIPVIKRAKLLIWGCVIFGAVCLYIIPFLIIRRFDTAMTEHRHHLREAEALSVVGEMSVAVAHGIRSPLATIRSSAELALDAEPEAAQKNANDIINQVDRVSKWVYDLLVFSRPVTGENGVINVFNLVNDCQGYFAGQLRKFNIFYEFTSPNEEVPLVVGNYALAYQAVISIVSNAIEAMPKGGKLHIQLTTSKFRRNVNLIINDSGPGMTANQINQVFKPFFTTKRNGLGLGMAQARRIMERFGGGVSLYSQLGHGTQVYLMFRRV